MNRKVGKVSWGSPALKPAGEEEIKRLPFLEMSGFNKSWKIRVAQEDPLRYWCHWTVNAQGKNSKVNCTLDESCPVMIDKTKTPCGGHQADARYYLKVLSKEDSTVKVLDVGKQIINGIGELISSNDWGHAKDYDITIKKAAKGSMPLYTVNPSPKSALAAELLTLINASEDPDSEEFIDLESRIQPYTADTINRILGNTVTEKKVVNSSKTAPAPSASSDDEFDDIEWGDED